VSQPSSSSDVSSPDIVSGDSPLPDPPRSSDPSVQPSPGLSPHANAAAFGDIPPAAGSDGEPSDVVFDDGDRDAVVEAADGWRRLSPRMLLVHPLQEARRIIIPLLVLVFFGQGSRAELWPLIGLAVVIIIGVTRWFTTTYRVTPVQVQVRRGLLSRSTITVPRDRVRTVDLTSHLLHRVLGLARITIGTGQTDRKKEELRLDALTVAASERLRTELLHERPPVAGADPVPVPATPSGRVLATLNPAWVRYAPFTLSGLVTIGVFAGFTANLINQTRVNVANNPALQTARRDLSSMSWVTAGLVIFLIIIVVVAVLSAGGYILQFWNFRLSRQGATLHVTRGLLTTRQTTIEERRLRGAEISEPLLLRWVRGARCVAITTGLRVGRGAERGGSILMPAAPADVVNRVAADVLATSAPVDIALIQHGRKAQRRRFTRAFEFAAIVTGIGAVIWLLGGSIWFPLVAAVMFPLGVYFAIDRYRNLGHALVGGYLVTRQGSAIRRRYMLHADGIIGWNEEQSFFQRRSGLVTLKATTAAGRGGYAVLDIEQSEAIALATTATPGLLTPFLTSTSPR
jgi:putative membrane protein